MRYRKKPVVIDAVLWDLHFHGDVSQFDYTKSDRVECEKCYKLMADHGSVKTLEGSHIVCPGDWIITGVKGEKYPCKPDIFELTYELAVYLQPLDVFLPDVLLGYAIANGDHENVKFEDMDIGEQSSYMGYSDAIIAMIRPYLKEL